MRRSFLLAAALAVTGTGAALGDGKTYRNPIIDRMFLADPAVIRVDGKYYLYPTSDSRGYEAYVSDDLVHWENKGRVYESPRAGLWAPDVFHNKKGDGKFYLYYTDDTPDSPRRHARKQIGVAVADGPLGPFQDKGVLFRDAIDAHLFQDDDGSYYLYFCNWADRGCVAGVRMTDPLTPDGTPKCLIRATEDWEKHGGPVTEGPWMLKHKGVYYLMYSGSGTDVPEYAVGYATASDPLGPYTKYAGNPVARPGGGVIAPGHHSVAEGPDGRLWFVYHQKKTERRAYDRFLAIDPLWFDEQGVIHTKLSRDTDQPAP
jgi:beta-xylosidase